MAAARREGESQWLPRRLAAMLALGALLISFVGCGKKIEDERLSGGAAHSRSLTISDRISSVAHGPKTPATDTLFEPLAAERTGIDLVHAFPEAGKLDLLADQSAGSGVCTGDIDGDGLPDVYITNYDRGSRLYKNLGDCKFRDVTEQANVSARGVWCAGPNFVDIDNDGDLDLYVCVYGSPNQLYVNNGDGTFIECAAERGLDFSGASVMMTFSDYDRDGDLDGYLVTHRVKDDARHKLPANTRAALDKGIIEFTQNRRVVVTQAYEELFQLMPKGEGRLELIIAGQRDRLYENVDGHFRLANTQAGIDGFGIGLAATWWDYNGDQFPDLYVSNDYKGADRFYHNNGDGTFIDVIEEVMPHIPWYSMGADTADINNDGLADFLATDMSGTSHFKQKVAMGDMSSNSWFLDLARPPQYMRNAMFLNGGCGRMFEVAQLTGISSTDWTWSPKFGDLDNDGRIDLFVANGMSRDFMDSDVNEEITSRFDQRWRDMPVLKQPNLAYRNQGDLEFVEVGKTWGLASVTASFGASYSDLDLDGDLDLIVTNFAGPVGVFRNNSQGNRLTLSLVGKESNRFAVGAAITLETDEGIQSRYVNSTQGVMSSNEPKVHFGLGRDGKAKRLTVRWPSGREQVFHDLVANHHYLIHEDRAGTAMPPPPPKGTRQPTDAKGESAASSPIQFIETEIFSGVRHRERPFDDFAKQPLLPKKVSQLGPAVATTDVNSDGFADFYFGGASGQPGSLFLGNQEQTVTEPFLGDAECEDVAAVFFDVDNDEDQDLYVVSGGVEYPAGSSALQDRLYLNDGNGVFRKTTNRIPRLLESGGCVAVGDYDRDGRLDLFIGGRVVPGEFPTGPASRLLRNDDGRLVDETKTIAPNLLDSRMVTGAVWSDVDGNGWLDLVLTQEWGPVELFINREGKLEHATKEAELSGLTGWWSGIAAADVDSDGDVDFVVTNLGLNTKYHASDEQPLHLYYGDFEGRGVKSIIEAKYEGGILLPERGKSCSTNAIPSLRTKFPSYKSFAAANLAQIYSEPQLGQALKLEATTLSTGLLMNQGNAKFRFVSLPRLSQVAPSNGCVFVDFNSDSHIDLVLAQNDFSPQRETGRMDGGMGLVLMGDGAGHFRPVWPSKSGIVVTGDARQVVTADLDNDGADDLVFGINDDKVRSFLNASGR